MVDSVRKLRNYGSDRKYHHDVIGFNSRLDEMQAAFLRVKLRYLDMENFRRRKIADRYAAGLADLDLVLPFVPAWAEPVWHLFVIRSPQRDQLFEHLRKLGVDSMIHYPVPPHRQPAYLEMGLNNGTFPISERIHREVISLPIGPMLSDADVDRVIAGVRSFF